MDKRTAKTFNLSKFTEDKSCFVQYVDADKWMNALIFAPTTRQIIECARMLRTLQGEACVCIVHEN